MAAGLGLWLAYSSASITYSGVQPTRGEFEVRCEADREVLEHSYLQTPTFGNIRFRVTRGEEVYNAAVREEANRPEPNRNLVPRGIDDDCARANAERTRHSSLTLFASSTLGLSGLAVGLVRVRRHAGSKDPEPVGRAEAI